MSNATGRIDWSAVDGIKKKIAAALYQEGNVLINKSVPKVPVDTGSLRSSHFVEQPKVEGSTILVKLGYGGTATKINPHTGEATSDYAVKVHEDLNMQHKTGEAKFLEKPAREYSREFASNMEGRLNI